MPVRRRRATYRRRHYVRRRPRMRRDIVYNVAPSGMPRTRVARLRYVQRLQLNVRSAGTNQFAFAEFNANGPFQPNSSVTNAAHIDPHQPMGYDKWAALFNNYVVKGSKITVAWYYAASDSSPTLDQSGAGRIGVYVTDSGAVAYTRATTFKEARKGQMRYINPNQRVAKYMNAYYSPRRVYGIRDIKDNQDRLGAIVNSLPQELCQYVVWASLDDPGNAGTVDWEVEVTIEYLIQFDEPVDLPQSVNPAVATLEVPRSNNTRSEMFEFASDEQ